MTLENDLVCAQIVPEQGARTRSLRDLRSGRELLYVRSPEHWHPEDYIATLAGGWDQMFPNDDPWQGLPVHGTLWASRFELDEVSTRSARLRCTLTEPAVSVEHHYELLEAPRCGLRLVTTVKADAAVAPFLWATHPMLDVNEGWRIDVGDAPLEADSGDPGRVDPGTISPSRRSTVLSVPTSRQGWQEVLYAPAPGTASVASPDGRSGTQISWDTEFFRELWVVTLSGFASVELALVLEPCTSRPYRLEEAIPAGTAVTLAADEVRTFWSEVESLDTALG